MSRDLEVASYLMKDVRCAYLFRVTTRFNKKMNVNGYKRLFILFMLIYFLEVFN